MRLLTVAGRTSGRRYTTPVVPLVTESGRWLVSPYGEVGWVRNARAAGRVTLSRGGDVEKLAALEIEPAAAVPMLRAYRSLRPAGWFVRSQLAFTPKSSDLEIAREAAKHPVFVLVPDDRPPSSTGPEDRGH